MTNVIVTADRPVAGILWMLVTGLMFVAVTAIVKFVGSEVPAAEAAFLRYLFGLVFLLPIAPRMIRVGLNRNSLMLFGLRGAVHSLGVILWFFAMAQIPIAEVTAMGYLSPIFVSIGAAVFLSERLAARRIGAIIIAFAGALVILRPGVREVSPGHLAMLANAVLFGTSYLVARVMAVRVPPTVVVGWLSVLVTLGLAPFAWAVWVWPDARVAGWLFLVAGFATAGHLTMTFALRAAPVAVTQPATFLQLVWATALGALVFAEPVDIWVILGGGLILGSVSFIIWREAVLKRRITTPPAVATKV